MKRYLARRKAWLKRRQRWRLKRRQWRKKINRIKARLRRNFEERRAKRNRLSAAYRRRKAKTNAEQQVKMADLTKEIGRETYVCNFWKCFWPNIHDSDNRQKKDLAAKF